MDGRESLGGKGREGKRVGKRGGEGRENLGGQAPQMFFSRAAPEQNRCKDKALRKAITLGSPRTAHVYPETLISKQQTHKSGGGAIWHAFTQFVKKNSVPDSVICCC